MKKWNLLERATTPDRSALTLYEHDGEYTLRVNGRELMSTRRYASELRLGELGGRAAARGAGARVLIGGLGLGFTLRGALATAHADAEIVVAELLEDVVRWNRDEAYPLSARELADPRTRVVIGDVFDVISQSAARGGVPFDAILLDADNGTTAMMTAGNRKLYLAEGVRRVRAALHPGGLVAYWSATADPELERLLRKLRFSVETEHVRAYGIGGPKHALIVGRPG